jgi:hypothetical protein
MISDRRETRKWRRNRLKRLDPDAEMARTLRHSGSRAVDESGEANLPIGRCSGMEKERPRASEGSDAGQLARRAGGQESARSDRKTEGAPLCSIARRKKSPQAEPAAARRRQAGFQTRKRRGQAPAFKVHGTDRRADPLRGAETAARVLPASAPPPVPIRRKIGITPWGTGRPRSERLGRSECASSPPSCPGSWRSRSRTSRPGGSKPACR